MPKDTALAKKRKELKQEINLGMHILLMGLIFKYTSRLIQKLTRSTTPPPFHHTAIVAAFLIQFIQLPGLLAAVILNETHQYSEIFVVGSLAIEVGFIGVLVAKLNINYVLQNLRDHVVDAIDSIDDLNDLQYFLSNFWSLQKQVSSAIIFGIMAAILSAIGGSQATRHFMGVGFIISAFLGWTIAVIPVYYLFLMALLPLRLSRYRYNLFEAIPVRSDVLRHLSLTLRNYTYVVALFMAFVTFFYGVNTSTRSWNIIVLLVGWIPLTIQFLSNRSGLKTIARDAKWKTLKEVEMKIRNIQKQGDLADEETIESINRLMDYHDRINATYDVALEVRARASFLNQLLLTLLAAALANIDSIIKFLQQIFSSFSRGFLK